MKGRPFGKYGLVNLDVRKFHLVLDINNNLVYSSQRDAKEFRLLHKAQKICRKLGAKTVDDLYTTPKPKGMYQKTYENLCDKATTLEFESSRMLMMKLEKISVIQERQFNHLKTKEKHC